MAGTTGIGTTYSLPNYHGELFAITPADTPLLSAIGGLTGGKKTTSTAFEWQASDLRDPVQPAVLEGANAPTSTERVRSNVSNVVQIHQSTVSVSYSKQAATGQYTTPGSAPFSSLDGAPNPVLDELSWQTMQELKGMALDVNYSFINGIKSVPTTNGAARQTGGLIEACATNTVNKGTALTGASASTDTITVTHALENGAKVVFTDTGGSTAIKANRVYYVVNKSTTVSFKVSATAGGSPITIGTATVALVALWSTTLTVAHIEEFVQQVYDNGGLNGQSATFLVSSVQKRAITAAYAAEYGKALPFAGTRNVAGVAVDTILTDFGTFNVMLDRMVPRDAIIACSLDQLAPVFLEVPGKGVFFEEQLSKVGAADSVQIYGEIGLEWGNEKAHGVLRGLVA